MGRRRCRWRRRGHRPSTPWPKGPGRPATADSPGVAGPEPVPPTLVAELEADVEAWNQDPKTFVWTKIADEILDNAQDGDLLVQYVAELRFGFVEAVACPQGDGESASGVQGIGMRSTSTFFWIVRVVWNLVSAASNLPWVVRTEARMTRVRTVSGRVLPRTLCCGSSVAVSARIRGGV
ncbi:hypothetical protein [Saccharothrix texasensis]|uniref:hypothetical protein n=1 Tax=Saccharothrix texasensis TaxID=103734 RepID=UPI000F4B61DF|nr:hypothetical protein [Saccharothrix texasensis]